MATLATVEVADAGDSEAVATRIALLFEVPSPSKQGGGWLVRLGPEWETVAHAVDDDPAETGGYPVSVDVFSPVSDGATDATARRLYDLLASRTSWGLRLYDTGMTELASRAAVTNVA